MQEFMAVRLMNWKVYLLFIGSNIPWTGSVIVLVYVNAVAGRQRRISFLLDSRMDKNSSDLSSFLRRNRFDLTKTFTFFALIHRRHWRTAVPGCTGGCGCL
jgi:hypothetical protein